MVVGGTTPSTSNPSFWGGDLCWISPAELHGEKYLYDSVKKITKEAVVSKSLKQLPVGTVILSSRAPIGKVTINKVPMYCNQGFKCVICGPELYNEYLYYWFWGNTSFLNSLGTGATFPEISKTVVENIIIPVPPMEEQERIVARLDAAFAQIDELRANAEKQLAEARALFNAALNEEMKPKKGWEDCTLGDVCDLMAGGDVPKNRFSKKKNELYKVPIYSNGVINEGLYGYTDIPKITKNCITISGRGTIGFVVKRTEPFFPVIRLIVAIPKDGLDVSYLRYCVISKRFERNGAAIPQLTVPMIKNVVIPIPTLNEQRAIVERLDGLSERVKELEEIARKTVKECDALKQSILRETFE